MFLSINSFFICQYSPGSIIFFLKLLFFITAYLATTINNPMARYHYKNTIFTYYISYIAIANFLKF